MNQSWNILYRGPLSSCNYSCGYCPFAKTRNSPEELGEDFAMLNRFVDWAGRRVDRRIGVLFTPWGEALIHRSYQQALLRLGCMPHVHRAAIQTNLSCSLDWLVSADRDTLALWCTFHPGETALEKFAAKIHRLHEMRIRHSVGVVGMVGHFEQIAALREAIPPTTYLWVNAYKREPDYYAPADLAFLRQIDHLFDVNNARHPSLGLPCRAGSSSFSVDGHGVARRCHFIPNPLGNIYDEDFGSRLAPSPRVCSNETCGCYIGYTNLPHLGLEAIYGEGILERIPEA